MPLYLAYCPDNANALEKRLAARPEHLALSAKSKEAGTSVFGRGTVTDEYTHHAGSNPPAVAEGATNPGMNGSVMIYRYPNIEAAWERLRSDPYWLQGVWDQSKATITEFLDAPNDATMKIV